MAERALRGMTIGSKSMESEDNVEFAPRMIATYHCECGEKIELVFAAEAEVPALWECNACGADALLQDAERPEPTKPVRPVRTHWDMLLERRSLEDLEVLLQERLELLRSGELRRRSA